MSVVSLIIGTAQVDGQFGGLGGKVLIYAGLFVLWGLIGLVPLLSKKPTFKTPQSPAPDWTVVSAPGRTAGPAMERLKDAALTIDGSFIEVREPQRLSGQDPRWGR